MYAAEELIEKSVSMAVIQFFFPIPKCIAGPQMKFPQLDYGNINTALPYHASVEEIHTGLCWVSGHTGVAGNEHIDTSARSATTNINRVVPTRAILHRHNGSSKGGCQKRLILVIPPPRLTS